MEILIFGGLVLIGGLPMFIMTRSTSDRYYQKETPRADHDS